MYASYLHICYISVTIDPFFHIDYYWFLLLNFTLRRLLKIDNNNLFEHFLFYFGVSLSTFLF